MKPFVALLALVVVTTLCHAQINFQPGYYLRNDGTRVPCLIKDYGWLNSPTGITCKNSRDAEPVTLPMDSIAEFGVDNAKYQRFEVDVETSGSSYDELTNSPVPKYRHLRAFLKLLVEGRASLYLYAGHRLSRYFFRLDGGQPRPLVSVKYVSNYGIVHENQEFLKVLADSLTCSAGGGPDPTSVRYDAESLTRYVIAYNSCVNATYTEYYSKNPKVGFHVNIRPGVDFTTLVMKDNTYGYTKNYSYGSETSFRLGAEAEVVLPFNRNKWAIVFEPEYRSYKSVSGGDQYLIDYKAVQILLGGRYFMFLSPASKFYLSAELFGNFKVNSTVRYDYNFLDLQSRFGEILSAGFRFKDRFGVELEYQFPADILANYNLLRTNMTTTSLIISWRVL